ncbi:hypothetical protein BJV85_003462 [Clostridium acetobutylicum]|nr:MULTISPECIES: hypothetical protein [Clostridium]NOV89354.1 hypothetical protein [Clostridium acetobutylicum]NOW16115.1 hypothetical protein [Clostridium acetobutylicum]NRY57795.1 hypothetical protein [Clostridium acetobutylicum]NSA94539.1 hypothetical protein [Clostridium acetobutylicum]NYC95701.1 hypothetical protein [Clostridium acetobutylicum]
MNETSGSTCIDNVNNLTNNGTYNGTTSGADSNGSYRNFNGSSD